MSESLPEIHVIRHGVTAWTESRRHTGLTDIPLTERGERQARRFGEHLRGRTFAHVFTSPLQRARRTCELAGFSAMAQIDTDLVEWNYGDYDGLTTAEIFKQRLTGSSSATAVHVVNPCRTLAPARTGSLPACVRSMAMH